MGDAIHFQTAHLAWWIQLERQDHHTTATVRGRARAVAVPMIGGKKGEPERCEQFTFTESDQDLLMDRIRTEIERLDGPITEGDSDEED
jgi:hypothetical protein